MREGDEAFEALREALEAFAAERAPELVAEAQAEALAKVRSMLAESMAQSLLHRAGDHLARGATGRGTARPGTPRTARKAAPTRETKREAPPSRTSAPPRAIHPARQSPEEQAFYVYGVARQEEAQLPEGLAGVDPSHSATLIEQAGLAAIVSRVSLAEFGEAQLHENLNNVDWLEDKARAHERVLDEALARTTVVPMRLCTIYSSASQVQEMLSREHEVLADALRRLKGKTEWGVKLLADPEALEQAASREAEARLEEEGTAASTGAAYMREKAREARVREAADQIAETWAQGAHQRLAEAASEALLNPLQNPEVSGHTGEMLLNGVYLVDDEDEDRFRRVVDELSEEYSRVGAKVELTGPWPPYNFVKSSIEAAR